ncbi:hypothetical protein HUJ04_007486 [Dendroctonus ponderosae]|nr:hypothetical protein HUJ04_007486 [Dendroctonus ponderosae]KAH1025523.1 hypothetical protein HUJ05_010232 [Dendroctonus ponderosae]
MSVDSKVCMLCLQSVDENSPCYALTDNGILMKKLEDIIPDIQKNLELIEEPVICNACNKRVNDLETFKQMVLNNECQMVKTELPDKNEYLKNLSEDTDICRLCLTSPTFDEYRDKNLEGNINALLLQCNINLKVDVPKLQKICNDCYKSVISMEQIISSSAKNANLIKELALKQAKLTSNQLQSIANLGHIEIEIAVDKTPEQNSLDTNPDALNFNEIEMTSTTCIKTNVPEDAERSTIETNLKIKSLPIENENHPQVLNTSKPLNTYKKRDRSYNDHLSYTKDVPSTSKAEFVPNNATDPPVLLQEKGEVELHASIDASPVLNISDITLNLDEKGIVEETVSECNATQELIDVLEGRLNDQQDNCQPLDMLEDGLSDGSDVAINNLQEETTEVKIINAVKKAYVKRSKAANEAVALQTATGSKQPNILRKSRPRSAKIINYNDSTKLGDEETPIDIESDDAVSTDEEKTARQKQNKKKRGKITEVAEKAEPPRKRARKMAEIKSTNETDDPSTSNEIFERETSPVGRSNSDSEDSDDGKAVKNADNKHVQITIIKGKRKSNKAQLDKTWQALTGKDKPSASAGKSVQGAETFPVKRRGRPPLSADKKASKPNRNEREWVHCDVCPYKTYSTNSFIQHQLIHNVMSTVEVLNCNTTHETPNLIYKCIFCDDMYKRKTSCMYHTLRHDDQDVASQFYCLVINELASEEYFECYQCDYQNPEEAAMPDHVIDHSVVKAVKNPIVAKFKCKQCQYRTKSEDMLARHLHLHDEKKKKLDKYVKVISTKIKDEPVDDDDEEELPLFKCTKCHYATRQKRSLANHIGLKHNRTVRPIVAGEAAMAKATAEGLPMNPNTAMKRVPSTKCA